MSDLRLRTLALAPGLLAAAGAGDPLASAVHGWAGAPLELEAGGTHFLYAHEGPARLECASGRFALGAGMYASVPGGARVAGGSGLAVTRAGFAGLFALGGPIEERGRLRYIDGCTDTLLLAPARRGDPCLNLLCFPPGTDQTAHDHPSLRAGLVARGRGECRAGGASLPLAPGTVFLIPPGVTHAFATAADGGMSVVAYHPDSDHGPTDDDHPMVNRTLVGGVPAARIEAIRTR